jgi:hypothetical protein
MRCTKENFREFENPVMQNIFSDFFPVLAVLLLRFWNYFISKEFPLFSLLFEG